MNPASIYPFYTKSEMWEESVKSFPQNFFRMKNADYVRRSRVVFLNICRNAIKFSHQNHIFIDKYSGYHKERLKGKINSNGAFLSNRAKYMLIKNWFSLIFILLFFCRAFLLQTDKSHCLNP